MVQRITYRRRLSYNTRSNRRKKVRTPGGKLVFQYLKKRPALPKCPMTGVKLKGIKPSRPAERKRLSLRHKKVFRAYGGKEQLLSIDMELLFRSSRAFQFLPFWDIQHISPWFKSLRVPLRHFINGKIWCHQCPACSLSGKFYYIAPLLWDRVKMVI